MGENHEGIFNEWCCFDDAILMTGLIGVIGFSSLISGDCTFVGLALFINQHINGQFHHLDSYNFVI